LKTSHELAEYHLILEDEFELSDEVIPESEIMNHHVKSDAAYHALGADSPMSGLLG
jgi:hypothetical protein